MNSKTIALTIALCASLIACGGNDSGSDTDTLGPGQSATIAHGQTLHVPAGTVVDSNGSQITVNGHQNTIHVVAGATVTVAASASGPADNLVIAD